MDENPYQAPQEITPANPIDEKKEADYPATLGERWGAVSVLFLAIALVGAVWLSLVVLTNVFGTGKPDIPGFPLMILFGSAWTGGALLLAWLFRK